MTDTVLGTDCSVWQDDNSTAQQHLISFHEHHLSLGWDRYGRYCIVNGGSLVDPNKLAFVVLDDTKSAAMMNGFVMLRNNTPYLFGKEPICDWSLWI